MNNFNEDESLSFRVLCLSFRNLKIISEDTKTIKIQYNHCVSNSKLFHVFDSTFTAEISIEAKSCVQTFVDSPYNTMMCVPQQYVSGLQ